MRSFVPLVAALLPVAFAQQANNIPCGGGSLCPQDTPCCSQYGSCGVGAYCLGGCDPVNSFSLDSCVPAPVCRSKDFSFDNLDGIMPNTKYLGDATESDWVSSGEPLSYDGNMLLTMARGTVGTLLASTSYVWYGKIGARFQTSAGKGVVTAFILLSDVKDEIDFEFVGVDLQTAQTNFYSQGVTNYGNGANASGISDTRANYHDYEIDWQPDQLTWSIDGKVIRTLKKSETWNATANRFTYPQTPARVQLSLWPAGLSTNPQGTIDWAGGVVDWNSEYMQNGYYYAAFDSVSIECYDPPSGANVQGKTSYIYTDKAATNNTVEISDNPTVLKSLLGSGINMTADYPNDDDNSSANSTGVATVPGLSGAGPGTNGQRGQDDSTSSSSNSNSNQDSSSSTVNNGFQQGINSAPGMYQSETAMQGSLFAVIVAIVGLCML